MAPSNEPPKLPTTAALSNVAGVPPLVEALGRALRSRLADSAVLLAVASAVIYIISRRIITGYLSEFALPPEWFDLSMFQLLDLSVAHLLSLGFLALVTSLAYIESSRYWFWIFFALMVGTAGFSIAVSFDASKAIWEAAFVGIGAGLMLAWRRLLAHPLLEAERQVKANMKRLQESVDAASHADSTDLRRQLESLTLQGTALLRSATSMRVLSIGVTMAFVGASYSQVLGRNRARQMVDPPAWRDANGHIRIPIIFSEDRMAVLEATAKDCRIVLQDGEKAVAARDCPDTIMQWIRGRSYIGPAVRSAIPPSPSPPAAVP